MLPTNYYFQYCLFFFYHSTILQLYKVLTTGEVFTLKRWSLCDGGDSLSERRRRRAGVQFRPVKIPSNMFCPKGFPFLLHIGATVSSFLILWNFLILPQTCITSSLAITCSSTLKNSAHTLSTPGVLFLIHSFLIFIILNIYPVVVTAQLQLIFLHL